MTYRVDLFAGSQAFPPRTITAWTCSQVGGLGGHGYRLVQDASLWTSIGDALGIADADLQTFTEQEKPPAVSPTPAVSTATTGPACVGSQLQVISGKLGMTSETPRKWVRVHDVDSGTRQGVPTAERERVRELEREVKELRRTNEMDAPPDPSLMVITDNGVRMGVYWRPWKHPAASPNERTTSLRAPSRRYAPWLRSSMSRRTVW